MGCVLAICYHAWRAAAARAPEDVHRYTPHLQQLGYAQLVAWQAGAGGLWRLVFSVTRVSCSGGEGGPVPLVDFLGLGSASAALQSLARALRPLVTYRPIRGTQISR
jgi:hypothetical protein